MTRFRQSDKIGNYDMIQLKIKHLNETVTEQREKWCVNLGHKEDNRTAKLGSKYRPHRRRELGMERQR
jgi:hypothetical protein